MKNLKVFTLIIIILVGTFSFIAGNCFSQQSAFGERVQFSSTTGVLKFFDAYTGKVYKYSDTDGTLMQVWILERLGENLKQEPLGQSIFNY